MQKKYIPVNPVISNFSDTLDSNISKALSYGKFLESVSKGKDVQISITDDSLAPYIKSADKVTVHASTIDHIEVGNFVLIRTGGGIKVRRVIRKIVRVGESKIYTKAENSRIPDNPTKSSHILGKVIKIERKGKEVKIPHAKFLQKITAFGTIPFYKIILRFLLSMIPFYHPGGEELDEYGRRKLKPN